MIEKLFLSPRARDVWFRVGAGLAFTLGGLALLCSLISLILTIKAGR